MRIGSRGRRSGPGVEEEEDKEKKEGKESEDFDNETAQGGVPRSDKLAQRSAPRSGTRHEKGGEQQSDETKAVKTKQKETRGKSENEQRGRRQGNNKEPGKASTPRERAGRATQLKEGAVRQSCRLAVSLQGCSLVASEEESGPNGPTESEE